jgi:hypothetical protein
MELDNLGDLLGSIMPIGLITKKQVFSNHNRSQGKEVGRNGKKSLFDGKSQNNRKNKPLKRSRRHQHKGTSSSNLYKNQNHNRLPGTELH